MPFNYATDRPVAEAMLRRLCIGAQIDGVRFGPILQLLITDRASRIPPVRGQIYLNLGSSWRIYSSRPAAVPSGEADIEDLAESEALRQLCELREATIAAIELGATAPDLLITFVDGRVFFLNGRHEEYEMWQVGVAFSPDAGPLVVACPGNEVAVWSFPESGSAAPAV